jgi:small subunit ribosomal protein S1
MSQPDNSDPNAPNSADPSTPATGTDPEAANAAPAEGAPAPAEGAPAPAEGAPTPAEGAPAPVEAPTEPTEAANAAPAEGAAPAAVGAEGGDAGEGDDEGEGEGEPEGQAAEGAPAEGGPPKKKRRRRRRKKGGGEAQAGEGAAEGGAPAEGTPAEGSSEGERPKRPKKEKVERERPAFNVGDVVFGKVLEVTDDALFADLSGKAKAIFDLRELLITEDEAEEYDRAHKKERQEVEAERRAGAEKAASAAPPAATEGEGAGAPEGAPATPAAGEGTPPESPSAAQAETEAAPHAGDVANAAAPAEPVPVAATAPSPDDAVPTAEAPLPTADASGAASPAAEGGTDAAEPPPGDDKPQLPRVILEPGAPFVGLVHNDGGRGGLVVLTHHPKRVSKSKPVVAEAAKHGGLVFGLVTGTIKGGVEVDVDGLRAFAPASHVELRPGADLSHLVGKRLPFAVTQYAKRGRDVVLSRRAMLESEAKEKREEALKHLQIGAVVDGIVRTVVPFGAFVDVGGVEGLVPLSEMSHNRADQPKDVFKVNETCRVKILRVDEKGKLWLSRRSAIEDPWTKVAEKYAPGTKHKGKVARLQPFGAFIELESGIDGLIHTADLSVKRIEHPEEIIKVGEELDVVVAHVDPKQHRIALHPAPTGEAANEAPQRIQIHKTVKVVVVNVENSGLNVRVLGATGRNARGYISASATGTPRGTELRKHFPVGKELEAKIIEHDPRRGELKLSIRALNDETERNAYQQYRAQVKREAKFGTFADLLAKRNIPAKE